MRTLGIPRRAFVQSTLAWPLLAQRLLAQPAPAAGASSALILREREPENLESPFWMLDQLKTPNELFYIRNHFAVPRLEAKSWKLKVEGAVERPFELDHAELLRLPTRQQLATMECAGNSRVFLTPAERGVQWELGAVGTAEWTGVSLATLLERAGVKKGAVEVVLEGADAGEVRSDPKSPGKIHFARSLPLAKAQAPEVLLAHRMNGAELTHAHGYPLRAVVPGWYGMAAVKWLTRIVVLDRPFEGFWQTMDYTYWERRDGFPVLRPITEMQVKAEIARPARGEVVPAGSKYTIQGAAWTGASTIAKVEVSVDGGGTWQAARLKGKPTPFVWSLWDYTWQVPSAGGRYTLLARATDARGQTQPLERDRDRRNYMISHVLPMEVEVRAT